MKNSALWLLTLLLLSHGIAKGQVVPGCGALDNHYGPFDYRTQKGKLIIVETAHFTPSVEALIRGSSSVYPGDDLSYTLRTSPNHHRALIAVMRFGERTRQAQPPRMQYSVDCYFERAVRFQPDDTVVRALFAQHLHRTQRTERGLEHLRAATVFAKDNPLSHYNIGLVYLELQAYDEALAQAHTAIALGMPPGQLAEKLKAEGRWREATPAAAADALPAPATSASGTASAPQ